MEGFRRPTKPKNLRRRSFSSAVPTTSQNSSDEDDIDAKIADIRESQRFRERKNGMTAVECAVGKELAKEFSQLDEDPFRMKGGGMLRLSDDRKAALVAADIENDIKEQFKKETLLRDEHEEMRKYINERLKRLGAEQETEAIPTKRATPKNFEDKILSKAAEQVKGYKSKSNDELLSNQMLVGIPEVDLGINVRMNNIIETERKKMELLNKNKDKNFTVVE